MKKQIKHKGKKKKKKTTKQSGQNRSIEGPKHIGM